MSNFTKQTKHPVTGEWEEASWLDDFFGKHIYGVQFIKDAVVYNADEIGKREKVTRERIRQIEVRAFGKLKVYANII